jgi:hypothetical protein
MRPMMPMPMQAVAPPPGVTGAMMESLSAGLQTSSRTLLLLLLTRLLAAVGGGGGGGGGDQGDERWQRTHELAAGASCVEVEAAITDPAMRWRCLVPPSMPTGDPTGRLQPGTTCLGTHIVCTPPAATKPDGRLAIFLPGTGLVPQNYSLVPKSFAASGLHAIGLSYPSSQGQNGCKQSRTTNPEDLNCTARERHRVLTGEPTSNQTNITQPDSIVNRIAKLLTHMGPPWSGWVASDGAPDWGRIVISGHSNGADHAAFLAKTFAVERAITMGGAQDYVGPLLIGKEVPSTYPTAAPWQHAAGKTPPHRWFGWGIVGTPEHPASWECANWHAGWDACEILLPYESADAIIDAHLAGEPPTSAPQITGQRVVSNGSWVSDTFTRDGKGIWYHSHMAEAGDCCAPMRADGLTVWTPVFAAMLHKQLAASPPATAATADSDADGGADANLGTCKTSVAPAPSAATPDLIKFETQVLPRWLKNFQIIDGTGQSVEGAFRQKVGGPPAPYGTADVIHLLSTMNQLNFSETKKDAWAAVLQLCVSNPSCIANAVERPAASSSS